MRPRDGLSNATNEDEYTASTPVDTKEFMSGEKRLSDASPERIRLAPGTTSTTIEKRRGHGRGVRKGSTAAFLYCCGQIHEVPSAHVRRGLTTRGICVDQRQSIKLTKQPHNANHI